MFHLKHDVQIHLKNEKQVFRLIRLLLFTFVLSATMFGLPDYIWNMTLYRISVYTVPWVVAIPTIVNCVERKVNFKELMGKHILFQVLVGILIGAAMAFAWTMCYRWIYKTSSGYYTGTLTTSIVLLLQYIFIVGSSEELIYRVGIMGELQQIFMKSKWVAPLIANILFATSHLFQHGWDNVLLAFFAGAVYTLCFYKWKKCGFVMVSVMHGMFDFMTSVIPAWNIF